MKKTNDKISYAQLKDLIGENNYNTLKKHKALKRWIRTIKNQADYRVNFLVGEDKVLFPKFLIHTIDWGFDREFNFWCEIHHKELENEN